MSTNGEVRIPPHNLEAEEAVLGAMLVTEPALGAVMAEARLARDDFYRERHRRIFEAIRVLYEGGGAVDAITVSEELKRGGVLDEVGGTQAVSGLASTSPAPGNARHYAEIVRNAAGLRRALALTQEVQQAIHERELGSDEVLEEIEARAFTLLRGGGGGDARAVGESLADAVGRLERRMAGERVEGLTTGFPDLDRKIHGLVPGRMVIVAARPGHGKSTLALNIAEHAARREERAVAFFSLEMSEEELADKLLIAGSGVDSDSFMEGDLEDADQRRVLAAANELDPAPIYIDDSANQTLGGIRSGARRLAAREARRGGLGLVVVDYLQLINPPRTGREVNRTAEVSEISRGLKLLASELDVPFLVCAQLNRAAEGRSGRRPALADLRESGAIEADANQVLLLFREEVYEEFPEERGVCEVQVAKNRHGQGGMVKLAFQGEHSRFRSLAREASQPHLTG